MPKKKIFYIVPHDFYPPKGGGALRVYHILKAVCSAFDTTLVYFSDKNNIEEIKHQFKDVKIYQHTNPRVKSKVERIKELVKNFHKVRSIKPLKNETFFLIQLLEGELKNEHFDFLFLEHLESYSSIKPILKKYFENTNRVINLHNIDHELWMEQYKQEPNQQKYLTYSNIALKLEKTINRNINKVLVCSENDANKIQQLNNNKLSVSVIPNGTKIITEFPAIKKNINQLLFVGSLDYFPNINGLNWFLKEIFPIVLKSLPDTKIKIVGRGGEKHKGKWNIPNVILVGEVEYVSDYYYESMISVVPLLEGSGTRLKIPESMAHKVPTVSTTKGAEGNSFIHNEHLLLADRPEEFANCIVELLSNNNLYNKLKDNGYKTTAQKFDWEEIGKKVTNLLK